MSFGSPFQLADAVVIQHSRSKTLFAFKVRYEWMVVWVGRGGRTHGLRRLRQRGDIDIVLDLVIEN